MTRRLDPSMGRVHPSITDRRRWEKVRARVLARDGRRCWTCGHTGADTADHLVSVAMGGDPWSMDNLAASHHKPCPVCMARCNVIRGAADIDKEGKRVLDESAPRWMPWR